jgi:energy-coupling factor transport system permease protein
MDLLRTLPIGLYLENPVTWLHRLDPRVKMLWLMGFLLTPLLANATWRLVLVGLLIALTLLAGIPMRVWRQQLGWLLFLAISVFVLTAMSPDGMAVDYQPRRPGLTIAPAANPLAANPLAPKATAESPPLPRATDYDYVLVNKGIFKVTRRSLDVAIRFSTLIFTLLHSTNLYLLTTAPEEISAGLEDLLLPLRRFGLPVTEIALTLTLALRYIPLVLEEIQNLGRSIWTRAIDWKKLGLRRSLQVWLVVAERFLDNLLLRAAQAASAMQIRGFTSPNQHRVQWHDLQLHLPDWIAMIALALLCGLRLTLGGMA